MNIENLPTDTLIPYARNAKLHSEEQVAAIAGSIREFGFNNPVLIDRDNGIIAGHGRVLAARKLNLAVVPCLRLTHLSETQRRAYILADNRLSEIGGGWDQEMLSLEIKGLAQEEFDLTFVGWTQAEVSNLFLSPNFEPGSEEEQGRLDEKALVVCPKCNHEFHA